MLFYVLQHIFTKTEPEDLNITGNKASKLIQPNKLMTYVERIEVLTDEGPRHAYVIATNVYQKTAQGWRMVAHHASPGTPREMLEVTDSYRL